MIVPAIVSVGVVLAGLLVRGSGRRAVLDQLGDAKIEHLRLHAPPGRTIP